MSHAIKITFSAAFNDAVICDFLKDVEQNAASHLQTHHSLVIEAPAGGCASWP